MNASARQVRSLRVRGADSAACRRGALMLEDALHTATLPDAEGSRLYVVRRLVVGTIGARQSSGQVAETLQSRFEEICSQAVHAKADGARFRAAVWFRDASEPSLLLALRLARREAADAWFWPLAVPVWDPTLTRDEALRALLHGAAETQTPPGLIVAAQFVAGLGAEGALAPLLEALTQSDGRRLLHTFGWPLPSQSSGATTSRTRGEKSAETEGTDTRSASASASSAAGFGREQAEEVQKGVGDTLYAAMIRRWGAADARSLWLSAMFLIAARPTRLYDAALLADAQRMAEQVDNLLGAPYVNQPRSAPSPVFPTSNAPSGETEAASPYAHSLSLQSSPESDRTREVGAKPQTDIGAEQGTAQKSDAANALQSASDLTDSLNLIDSLKASDFLTEDALSPLSARGAGGEPDSDSRSENAAPNAPMQEEPSSLPAFDSLSSFSSFDVLADIPLATEYAGLYFLVAALDRLGMGRLSETQSRLFNDDFNADLGDDFPIRLLHHVGRKMGIEAEDPILAALPLPIRAPENAVSVETRLLDAWRIALRRWCRRYAGMGLDTIIRRNGRVRATRTHIDIWLDLGQADIRVRKAGLDIDPGWVPWLGRVILFHYTGGG